jgi:hypothetical protein
MIEKATINPISFAVIKNLAGILKLFSDSNIAIKQPENRISKYVSGKVQTVFPIY